MRELKFRLRDDKNRVVGYERIQPDEDGFLRSTFSFDNAVGGWIFTPIKHSKKDQYTGLHDKNGKEIYEGDILDMFPKRKKNKIYDYIVFSEGCFCLANAIMNYELTYGTGEGVVIGNIYENPELLK